MSSEECSASGVLPYLYKNGVLYFMLGLEGRGLSDFGGFSDHNETAFDNASREFSEETMGLFCLTHELRGNKQGVIRSSAIMKTIISSIGLHDLLVKKVINPSNRYQMYIAPVARWVLPEEFERTSDVNDKRAFAERIRCVEKQKIAWFNADELLDSLNEFSPSLKVDGFTEKVFTQFRRTLLHRDSLEFIKFLQRQDPTIQTQLINQFWIDS
ncbi:hypothetical protein PPL_00651 [Heterostelium album PN500]|uniref:Nudix hydrolase domain-containing protein n=1 Tax=Heterostelium pallidum (strain ATCC 26659 / Pp 5 / PN500) TaxID=670386 RepID=D3AX23_HETP5|nr:hypothetical protein PPL_00651 [Heterostelium album PN500]EFA86846.1 hypothetical protein PPL_00651 [Heterostelium album PN500]|eukprot:XP_020438949.1 hypothetical protein PPL_00651 [Heterostelium album PN500]